MTNRLLQSFPAAGRLAPSLADVVSLLLVFGLLALLADGSRGMLGSLAALQHVPISLDPSHLPEYAIRTTLRMLAALLLSLTFTLQTVNDAHIARCRAASQISRTIPTAVSQVSCAGPADLRKIRHHLANSFGQIFCAGKSHESPSKIILRKRCTLLYAFRRRATQSTCPGGAGRTNSVR